MKKIFILLGLGLLLLPQLSSAQSAVNNKIAVKSIIAANNTTPVVIKTVAGTVYSIDAFNNSAALAYVKLYNTTLANVVCGTTTPYARYMIPFGASSSGGGFSLPNLNGDAYVQGITACITLGIADSDATAPAANTIILNVHYQ